MNHLKYLDGLRGVACILVVLSHLKTFIHFIIYGENPNHPFNLAYGSYSVCVFFLLSAYALIYKFHSNQDGAYLTNAFVKRYCRLTPLVFVSIIISYCFAKLGLYQGIPEFINQFSDYSWIEWLKLSSPQVIPFKQAIYDGLLGVYIYPFKGESFVILNSPLWTMPIELFGSLLLFAFVGLFYCLQNKVYFVFTIIMIAAIMLLVNNKNTGICISLFFIGAAMIRIKFHRSLVIFIIPAIYFTITNGHHNPFLYPALGAICTLVALLSSNFLQNILSSNFFVFLGKISFSIYVMHNIVLSSISYSAFLLLNDVIGNKQAAIIAIIITFLITIPLAYICYQYIDLPSQKIASVVGKKILGKRNKLN